MSLVPTVDLMPVYLDIFDRRFRASKRSISGASLFAITKKKQIKNFT